MYNFSNKVVLVTGGTGNLGSQVVKAFAEAGAKLVVPDRVGGRLATLFPGLAASPDHYLAEEVDVSEEKPMQRLTDETMRRFGRIDVLVNTVGGWEGMKLTHETSLETWDKMMSLNGRTIFNICRTVLPMMIKQQEGKIVNVGARQALVASEKEAVFAASKSALAHLTVSMAAEYKKNNININAVMPSMLDSLQARGWMPNADPEQFVTVQAVSEVILFLASSEAQNVSGALLPAYGKLV